MPCWVGRRFIWDSLARYVDRAFWELSAKLGSLKVRRHETVLFALGGAIEELGGLEAFLTALADDRLHYRQEAVERLVRQRLERAEDGRACLRT